jgi:hypothetical protein
MVARRLLCPGSVNSRALQVGILTFAIAAASGRASAQEAPRLRLPLALHGGYDTPLGTAGLSFSLESAGGWGVGAGFGFKDAVPGDLDLMLAVNARAPILRAGRFDLAGLLIFSRGDRATERRTQPDNARFLRWSWDPGYRVDLAFSARWRGGPWGLRVEAGVGYLLNPPRCYYVENNLTDVVVFVDGPCTDPLIPADEDATDLGRRFAPFVALVGEYDLAAALGRSAAPSATIVPSAPAAPVPERREANAWLAPTALTLGRGGFRATLYEGLAPEIAVGITERLQVSAGVAVAGSLYGWKTELKVGLLTQGRLRLAAIATWVGFGSEENEADALGGGAVASVCFDEACRSLASLAVHAGAGRDGGDARDFGLVASPSAIVALGPHVKLVSEVHTIPGEGVILVGLVRLPFYRFWVDIGAASDTRETLPAGSAGFQF